MLNALFYLARAMESHMLKPKNREFDLIEDEPIFNPSL